MYSAFVFSQAYCPALTREGLNKNKNKIGGPFFFINYLYEKKKNIMKFRRPEQAGSPSCQLTHQDRYSDREHLYLYIQGSYSLQSQCVKGMVNKLLSNTNSQVLNVFMYEITQLEPVIEKNPLKLNTFIFFAVYKRCQKVFNVQLQCDS